MTETKRAFLVALRERGGLSCAEVARRCGVVSSTVLTWEAGVVDPHPVNVARWERAVGHPSMAIAILFPRTNPLPQPVTRAIIDP